MDTVTAEPTSRRHSEPVVLVDEENEIIGTMPKAEVHHGATPLHRGFSLFLFDDRNRVILQQRASTKVTWPDVWSNSCCGHELPGEEVTDAARRRARRELGVEIDDVRIILPDYRYRAELHGVVENEYCPVMVARMTQEPAPAPDEVRAIDRITWIDLAARCEAPDSDMSPWCIEEVRLLSQHEAFRTRDFCRPVSLRARAKQSPKVAN